MKKNERKPEDLRVSKLDKALRGVSAERLRAALVKDRTLTMRISETDRLELKKTAQDCGLTATEYLMRLHYFAVEMLKGERGKAKN